MSIRNVSAPALLIAAVFISLLAPAEERERHEVHDVKVVNTPSVNVVNTPSVNVANTANVNVTNTPTVQVSGTASVAIKNDNSTPVITKNANEKEPFVVQAQGVVVPLSITLPSVTASGAKVKTVIVEFVSSDCDATPGTQILGAARMFVPFAGQFIVYGLPSGQPMSFSNAAEFVTAQSTLIFADPGASVTYGFSGGGGTCSLVLSGHLVPQ